MPGRIVCIGQLVADILVKPVDRLDYAFDTTTVEHIAVRNGGDAMNTAVALAKLGNDVGFIGRVGRDLMGQYLRSVLENAGIDAGGLSEDPVAGTSTCLVLINRAAERAFFYYGGANSCLTASDVPPAVLEGASIVHVGGTFLLPGFDGEGAAQIFEAAHQQGCLTSMDVTFDPSGKWLDTIRPCLRHLDYFLPSYNEASRIARTENLADIVWILKNEGVKNIIVKLGAKGCYVHTGSEEFEVPAFNVPVVDTTGAGDCFVAGFLTGLNQKLPLQECAMIGCASAAFCIGALGATENVRSYAEIRQLIDNRF